MVDNVDSVVLFLTVRSNLSSDATLLRFLTSVNRFKQETILSLGYAMHTLHYRPVHRNPNGRLHEQIRAVIFKMHAIFPTVSYLRQQSS